LSPSQGFRHAVALLIDRWLRGVPAGVTPEDLAASVSRLARELAGLADDMRAGGETGPWLVAEFTRTLDRLPQAFDRTAALANGTAVLSAVGTQHAPIDPRDLFLVYAPEDRLPIAAPLAVELTKQRISVAFADYEITSGDDVTAALQRGLALHRGGAVLSTRAFGRLQKTALLPNDERLRVVQEYELDTAVTLLAAWARQLKTRSTSK
jgi:hypothetical protein